MRWLMILLLGLVPCGRAEACSCAAGLTSGSAREASNVFVFRLLSAQADVSRKPGAEFQVTGRIQVLANVRGRTTSRDIDFSTYWCCGIRMEVGKEYIGFLPSDARHFRANAGNVLPLSESYGKVQAEMLEAVLRGTREIDEAFSYGVQEIMQIRPPPAPCPR